MRVFFLEVYNMTTMNKPHTWLIPQDLMVKAVQETADEINGKPGIDNWGEHEGCLCRSKLPVQYHHIETDIIRRYAGNIRRNPEKFGYVSPLGKTMGRDGRVLPDWLLEYIDSPQWKFFRDMKAWPFWENVFGERCCAACPSKTNLDMHHRKPSKYKNEVVTDTIPLCRSCHDRIHGH